MVFDDAFDDDTGITKDCILVLTVCGKVGYFI
jgi:hypothetical protein